MTRIAHLSDLHFGQHDPAIVAGLEDDLLRLRPALLVVSGDLTQRARSQEFRQARAFLERIPAPRIVVPGNHDIPLYDLARRFIAPLGRFRRHIDPIVEPAYEDAHVAVLGLNTARSATWKHGRLSHRQIERIRTHWAQTPTSVLRVLVTHHPFVPAPARLALVGRAPLALDALEAAGVDLLLAGHHHVGYAADLRRHHKVRRSVLVAQAGTATSHRRRQEPNSYNLMDATREGIRLEVRAWDGARFVPSTSADYARSEDGWERLDAPGPRRASEASAFQPFGRGETPAAAP